MVAIKARAASGKGAKNSEKRASPLSITAAAKAYVAKHTKSKEAARAKLYDLGINTKTGRLTKNYK